MNLLPYGGMTRIRFKGYFSLPQLGSADPQQCL